MKTGSQFSSIGSGVRVCLNVSIRFEKAYSCFCMDAASLSASRHMREGEVASPVGGKT